MLTSQMRPFTSGQGATIGWTQELTSGQVSAFVPGPDGSPLFLGQYPHRPAADSAILDREEAEARRREVRATLVRQERDRLERKIEAGTRKIARLMKQLPQVTDRLDQVLIEREIIRTNEEVKLSEQVLWALA